MCTLLIALFSTLGFFQTDVQTLMPAILATSLSATVVESFPVNQFLDDNFSVPAAAAMVGQIMTQMI